MVDNRFKKKKLNNQGVTLVELLVAVAIIGIIVGPFLHAFVSSIQTNSKARNSLRATTVAQDIIEGIKAYEIEELGYQFNFPDKGFNVIHNGSVSGGSVEEVLYSGGAYTTADPSVMPGNPLHASVYSGDSGNTYTFLGQNSGTYYFTMSNISFENKKYDALITLSANAYKTGGTSTVLPNDEPVVTIDKMDNIKDAYYVQKTGMDTEEVTKLNESLSPGNSILKADVSRTFTIDISNTVVPGKPDLTKVSVSYNYVGTVTGDPTQSKDDGKGATIFNNKISGEKLTHIYLFYFPLYSGWKSDNIVIKNNNNVPVVVHLVKQEDPDPLVSVTSLENTYNMNLSVQENTSDITKAVTSFQTNLNVNITNQLPVVTQAKVKFNNNPCNLSDLEVHGIVKKEKKDRLFDIYVDVYQEGSASAGFPTDRKLVSFDSSKQD